MAGPGPSSVAAMDVDCAPSAERLQYVIDMRRKFSPPGMLNPDGSINQDFFKPRRVVLVQERAKWGDVERDGLYKGLEVYGVGKWREISTEFLRGQWDDQQVRIRAARLMGTQSLQRYVGWKGSRAAVEAEYAKNKAIGEATGCWKGGVLVEDDHGTVRKYFEAQAAAAAAGGSGAAAQ
ncbi:hypothetical protein HYH03_015212 [Edaphochlamys debaryana]|uniref:Myb-like domain-containing protein n=1 Tax=Edaphochlamys debaryana TaxID=47281 RepID=A0A836BRG7_9CHLO|nr:hypothetical protein HYH03_015212 [Edaphochlamys debaryana]|eukprot:KAG2486117.1 hypothetical protein HYH03_015212 [Edaphochlamys debaryana]